MPLFPRPLLASTLLCLLAAPVLRAEFGHLEPRPRVLEYHHPRVPRATYQSDIEVDLLVEINESGRVIFAAVQRASDPSIAVPCLRAVRTWRFAPVLKDGQPTRVRFMQPLRFGSRNAASLTAANLPARPRRRVQPKLPADLRDLRGEVLIAFSVTPEGEVSDVTVAESTAPELNDATIDAALRWKFRPALEDGRAVDTKVYIPFRYVAAADIETVMADPEPGAFDDHPDRSRANSMLAHPRTSARAQR